MPHLAHETQHGRADGVLVAGVDEVGRGPLAGDVVAGAVVLPKLIPESLLRRVDDSKRLNLGQREAVYPLITAHCAWGIGVAAVAEIDALNILQASLLAMQRAVAALSVKLGQEPAWVLVDGNRAPLFPPPSAMQTITIVKGDQHSLSIAAASILAKVTRDRMMLALHQQYPHYGWDKNMGYPTASHRAALARHGLTPHHRRSFAPVKQYL